MQIPRLADLMFLINNQQEQIEKLKKQVKYLQRIIKNGKKNLH